MSVHFNELCVLITVTEIQLKGELKKKWSDSNRKGCTFCKSHLEYIFEYYSKSLGESFLKCM